MLGQVAASVLLATVGSSEDKKHFLSSACNSASYLSLSEAQTCNSQLLIAQLVCVVSEPGMTASKMHSSHCATQTEQI